MNPRITVLIVAMCDSVHTARWIRQFSNCNVEFVLYPSTPHRRIHQDIRQLLSSKDRGYVRLRLSDRWLALPLGLLDLLIKTKVRARRLRKLISAGEFDFVHLLETQHAGYLYREAVWPLSVRPVTALSVWGSDLVWFYRSSSHRRRIGESLKLVDLLFTECSRDQLLARELGYQGQMARKLPASGGLSNLLDSKVSEKEDRASLRRVVMVKGYTGFVGRAHTAIRALITNADLLRSYQIHIYSVSLWLFPYLRWVRHFYSLNIVAHRKKALTHEQIMRLFSRARISLSVSLSDGFSGSSREAAWSGAFPIESKGSCVAEWLQPGQSCLLVDPESDESVAGVLRNAILDDELVDSAMTLNREYARMFSSESVRTAALSEYVSLFMRSQRGLAQGMLG